MTGISKDRMKQSFQSDIYNNKLQKCLLDPLLNALGKSRNEAGTLKRESEPKAKDTLVRGNA